MYTVKLVIVFNLITFISCEMYSSVYELKQMADEQGKVLYKLMKYVEKEQQRLDILKSHLKTLKAEQTEAVEDVHKYVGNPVKAFSLIKRLTVDLDHIISLTTKSPHEITPLDFKWPPEESNDTANVTEAEKTILRLEKFLSRLENCTAKPDQCLNNFDWKWNPKQLHPTDEDVIGAAMAIARLQEVYKLDTRQLARGKVAGAQSSPMKASDCYVIARILFKENLHNMSAQWFKQALRLFSTEKHPGFTKGNVMKYLIKAYHNANLTADTTAVKWAIKLYKTAFKDFFAEKDTILVFYKHKAEQIFLQDVIGGEEVSDTKSVMETYFKLCRGQIETNVEATSRLHCSYLKRNPFLRLAPVKMEVIHEEAGIVLFHDILSDEEIETIKELAKDKLERAKVGQVDGSTTSTIRIGKYAWISQTTEAHIQAIKRRTADFTGLNLDSAEALQALNYGIGGHFDLHYDQPDFNTYGEYGKRIATVLFYMSEDVQGGATVFPKLGLSVKPKKGMALYWRNLLPSGQLDTRMLHAGCAVLSGSKWVANYWIHEKMQELTWPCPVESLIEPSGEDHHMLLTKLNIFDKWKNYMAKEY